MNSTIKSKVVEPNNICWQIVDHTLFICYKMITRHIFTFEKKSTKADIPFFPVKRCKNLLINRDLVFYIGVYRHTLFLQV